MKKKLTVAGVLDHLSRHAPFDLAEDWDNVGLIAGNSYDLVAGVVVAVNLGPEALDVARKEKCNLIVCHHPPIFKPVLRLTRFSSPYLYEAIQRGISVIALHTNFDLASESLSRQLARELGFEFEEFLAPRS